MLSDVFPLYTLTAEETARDLIDLNRLKAKLQAPSYIWERHAGAHCAGVCEHPKVVAHDVSGTIALTCCELWPSQHRLYTLTLLERRLREKLARELHEQTDLKAA